MGPYRKINATSMAAVGGTCTATFPPVNAGREWLVSRLYVRLQGTDPNSISQPIASIYDSRIAGDQSFVDATRNGNLDIAEYPSYVSLDDTNLLIVVWSLGTGPVVDGSIGLARIWYQVI